MNNQTSNKRMSLVELYEVLWDTGNPIWVNRFMGFWGKLKEADLRKIRFMFSEGIISIDLNDYK